MEDSKQDEKAETPSRKNKCQAQIGLYSHTLPSRRNRRVSTAGGGERFPLSSLLNSQQNPQTGRHKGKGRVCLEEDGDSKEEDAGKEERMGVDYRQHWSNLQWEELKKPIEE